MSQKSILIVDDSPSIRREVKMILEKEGYSVREAGTEFGMLSNIDQYGSVADLILMDLNLNGQYGFDLVEKIKKMDRFKNIPVVMLTQHSDRDSVVRAKILGVQGYIVKPVNPHILKEKVKKTLDEVS